MADLTGKSVLRSWILLSLNEMGGNGSRREVLDYIEERFGDALTDADRAPRASRPSEAIWRNNASWERASLVSEGLLEEFVERGDPWKLTAAGVALATNLGTQKASSSPGPAGIPGVKQGNPSGGRPFDPSSPPKPPSKGEVADPDAAQALSEKAVTQHHELLVSLTEYLSGQGWSGFWEEPGAYDLLCLGTEGLGEVFFEAKTISDSNERSQVRSAIGQLLEYRLEYGEPGDFVCLVATRKLSNRRAELLEALEIAAIHEEDGTFVADNDFGDLILSRSEAG